MYLSKETFEKWRRGEVRMEGNYYPVCDLTDDDFIIAEKKPDTVYGPQTDEYPEEAWLCYCLDAMDSPLLKADLLYVMRKYLIGEEYNRIGSDRWDGSYVSMLQTYLRHHGEYVLRKHANKRHVDTEEWGPGYDEVFHTFRKALCEIEEWEEINDEKYSEFHRIVNNLRNKEDINEEDILELWSILFLEMDKHEIKDEKFKAFEAAFYDLDDYDAVYQNAHMDIMDNGKRVRIHIWGRDDG
ncbi:MAG: hypothetical protein FWG41_03840 [Methanomassiliicoccaceae archaeon]|nr:hypothetical protein [Methanomassiliicoccaceae archaeon]